MHQPVSIDFLGLQEYQSAWQAMSTYTSERQAKDPDRLWVLQHPPVFTQGQAGREEHVLDVKSIPIVQSDRGGQVTYHGPGQLIVYTLIDLRRRKLSVREMVSLLENSAIELLNRYDIAAAADPKAPGVYVPGRECVDAQKIASVGLRVRKGCCFHGISLNVDMDLRPFEQINPCGLPGMRMTQLKDCLDKTCLVSKKLDFNEVERSFVNIIACQLNE